MTRMSRTWGMLAMGCALLLAACTPATVATGGPAPPGPVAEAPEAPAGKLAFLKGTHVDNEAIRTATATMRATVSVSAALRAVGMVKPGTPKALAIADGLDALRRWINAATEAQQLGEQATAYAAFQQAEAAYASILRAIGS